MSDPHDWTTDPRPLSECLKDFNRRINGGREYGARETGAHALGIKAATYAGLLAGRPTPYEATIRLAMVEAERRAAEGLKCKKSARQPYRPAGKDRLA